MVLRIILILTLYVSASYSQVTVVNDSVFSRSLNTVSPMLVLLPDGYHQRQERYPMLVLLHGLGGDHTNWVKLTRLVHYAREYRFIIVTPNGRDGWYSNSPLLPHSSYEDLIISEVIPHIDRHYRTFPTGSRRAIAGLSMGGYGAVKLGLKYPGMFFFAAGISPSMQFPAALEDSIIVKRWSRAAIANLRVLFGNTRAPFWDENDITVVTEKAPASSLPYFYLSAGSQDGILEIPEQMHGLAGRFRTKGIPFEMHELPGKHDWKFWDAQIAVVLRRMSELLERSTDR